MSDQSPSTKTMVFWVLSATLGMVFLMVGAAKLLGAPMQLENFVRWGLPDALRPVVGLVEVAAAVLLFIPQLRLWGASALAATMVGAALTHLVSGVDVWMVGVNAALLGLSGFIGWTHRPRAVGRTTVENGGA